MTYMAMKVRTKIAQFKAIFVAYVIITSCAVSFISLIPEKSLGKFNMEFTHVLSRILGFPQMLLRHLTPEKHCTGTILE